METKYTHHARSVTRLKYHVVLVCKYRRKTVSVLGESIVKQSIQSAVARCDGVKLVACGLDENHIHLIIDSPPYWSVSQLVGRIKQLSTNFLWEREGGKLGKMFYKNKVFYTKGFFAETVGRMNENRITGYVREQGR